VEVHERLLDLPGSSSAFGSASVRHGQLDLTSSPACRDTQRALADAHDVSTIMVGMCGSNAECS